MTIPAAPTRLYGWKIEKKENDRFHRDKLAESDSFMPAHSHRATLFADEDKDAGGHRHKVEQENGRPHIQTES